MAPGSGRYVLPMSAKITFFPGRCQVKSPRSQGGESHRRLESVRGRAGDKPGRSGGQGARGFVASPSAWLRASSRAQPSGPERFDAAQRPERAEGPVEGLSRAVDDLLLVNDGECLSVNPRVR